MSGLSRAAANRAHVLVITAHAHAVEVYRAGDADQALAALDTNGAQTFQFTSVFTNNTSNETAESVARLSLPAQLAEKRWCLRGWSIDRSETLPVERPKGIIVILSGTCKQ
jgi:hypothetical protein